MHAAQVVTGHVLPQGVEGEVAHRDLVARQALEVEDTAPRERRTTTRGRTQSSSRPPPGARATEQQPERVGLVVQHWSEVEDPAARRVLLEGLLARAAWQHGAAAGTACAGAPEADDRARHRHRPAPRTASSTRRSPPTVRAGWAARVAEARAGSSTGTSPTGARPAPGRAQAARSSSTRPAPRPAPSRATASTTAPSPPA